MTIEPLRRTTYRDPTPTGNPPRTGTVTHEEALVDAEQYEQPLERIHGSNLHGWGVATGLTVTATLNAPGLQVLPGVALDGLGRHISLAAGGFAEIGPTADSPGTPPKLKPAASTGVKLPTTRLSGPKYLTIEFRETFDSAANTTSGTFQYNHTPWLRLFDIAGFTDDGKRIILALATLGSAADLGKVTALTEGSRRRTSVSLSAIQLTGSQSRSGNALSVGDIQGGKIGFDPNKGLLISSKNIALEGDLLVDGDTKLSGHVSAAGRNLAADGQSLDDLVKQVAALTLRLTVTVPIGTVTAFAGSWPPKDAKGKQRTEFELGWLLCDGRTITGPEYEELRAVLVQNTLPDYWGYFLRGIDGANVQPKRDQDGIRSPGSVQEWATHMPRDPFFAQTGGAFDPTHGDNRALFVVVEPDGHDSVHEQTDNTPGEINIRHGIPVGRHPGHTHSIAGGDTETRPSNVAVFWIIKYT